MRQALSRLRHHGWPDDKIERTYRWWSANYGLIDPDGTPESFYSRFGEWVYMATPANELE